MDVFNSLSDAEACGYYEPVDAVDVLNSADIKGYRVCEIGEYMEHAKCLSKDATIIKASKSLILTPNPRIVDLIYIDAVAHKYVITGYRQQALAYNYADAVIQSIKHGEKYDLVFNDDGNCFDIWPTDDKEMRPSVFRTIIEAVTLPFSCPNSIFMSEDVNIESLHQALEQYIMANLDFTEIFKRVNNEV